MEKGQTILWIMVGVLIIAGVAGGAYYLGRQTTQKPSPSPVVTSQTSQPSPIKDASPAPNGAGETANWKTYTDQKYGFSFQYPNGWRQLKSDLEDISVLIESQDYEVDKYTPDLLSGGSIRVVVQSTLKNLSQIEAEIRSPRPANTDVPEVTDIAKVSLNSKEAIKYKSRYGADVLVYVLVDKGVEYLLSCDYVVDSNDGLKLCEQITGTFKL